MSDSFPLPRSYLFVPGTRPERFAKALATGADAVVLDLEDAVAIDDKATARDAIVTWLSGASADDAARMIVRINDAGAAWFDDDLKALAATPLEQVMLPKAEAPEQVARVLAMLPTAKVLALIESAIGVAEVDRIAAVPGVQRLVFGTLDYALDLALETSIDPIGLAYAASRIAIASRVNGLPAPVAGVTPQLDDESHLFADWAHARAQGFGAKLCIHPKQIAPLHRAMTPAPEAIDWARRVIAADSASPGAARLDGRMVDRPVVLQAQRVLALVQP